MTAGRAVTQGKDHRTGCRVWFKRDVRVETREGQIEAEWVYEPFNRRR